MSAHSNAANRQTQETYPGRLGRHSMTRTGSLRSVHQTAPARPHAHRAPAQSLPTRDEMAVKLLSLVKRVAFEMRERLPQHVEVDDLAGAGAIGLLDAVRKFDAHKHVKIETYARYRIRGAILDSLRDLDTASRDMRRKNKTAEKVYQQLQTRLGRAVTDEEMASALGISLRKWYSTVQELNSMGVEWMRPNQIPETSVMGEANIPADNRENPFDHCYHREQRDILAKVSAALPERERAVISLYYQQAMTMKQIAKTLNIDESRVSQIHSAAVSRLRAKVRKMLNPAYASVPPAFIAASKAYGAEAAQ